MTLSPQQELIHQEFQHGSGHVVIVARAGVGKTTTAISGALKAPESKILFTCFNKRIKDEGNAKLKQLGATNAVFQTIHSLGYSAVTRFWEGVRLCDNFERQTSLTLAVCGGTAPDAIKRLVSKLHTLAREIVPHATKAEELFDLAIQFECEPAEEWEQTNYNLEYVCARAVEAMEIAASRKPADGLIDFADMIFLPVRNSWLTKSYDLVIVDEAQDLTVAKLEVAHGVCRGRLFIIGDDKQAIYGFCGADTGSLARLQSVLNAKELHLTRTYRCGKAIVREAQRLVPDFEAADTNSDGEVLYLPIEKLLEAVGPGNFILSRLNAPLVSIAMRLLRNGKRCRIAGRDIGKGLIALVRKFRAKSVPDLLGRINTWQTRETIRLTAKFSGKLDSPTYQQRLEAISDQAEMLCSLTDNCRNVDEVTNRIVALFTDDGLGDAGVVTCSSVHKAKGLEADKVFVLMDTMRDNSDEERNILYVAVTRAINTLVYVRGL